MMQVLLIVTLALVIIFILQTIRFLLYVKLVQQMDERSYHLVKELLAPPNEGGFIYKAFMTLAFYISVASGSFLSKYKRHFKNT